MRLGPAVGTLGLMPVLCGTAAAQLLPPKPTVTLNYIPLETTRVRAEGDTAAFGSTARLSWRQSTLPVECQYQRPTSAAAVNGTVEVYAFALPPAPVKRRDTRGRALRATSPSPASLVYTAPLRIGGPNTNFTIPFERFAPTAASGYAANLVTGGSLSAKANLSLPGKGLAPKADSLKRSTLRALMQTRTPAERAKVMAEALIREAQDVSYYVRVVPEGGSPSLAGVVSLGEPPPPVIRSTLEVLVNRGTPEFPDETWGFRQTWGSHQPNVATFRWKTSAPDVKKAILQVAPEQFPGDPLDWNHSECNLIRETVTTIPAKDAEPVKFTADFTALPDAPGTTERKYVARIVPLRADGSLAGFPSNMVPFTVPAAPPAQAKPSPLLSFETSLVGYLPAHLPHPDDAYRFVLAGPAPADLQEKYKQLTGQSTLTPGTKIYLPPEPPEDKSWWEKFKTVIATILDVLEKIAVDVPFAVMHMVNTIIYNVQLAGLQVAGMSEVEAYHTIAKFNELKGYGNWALGAPDRLINQGADAIASELLDGAELPSAQRAKEKANIAGSVRAWAKKNSALAQVKVTHHLNPDPDFQEHPAVVFLKVRAKGPADQLGWPYSTDVSISSWTQNAELLGVKPELRPVFQKTVSFPAMAGGEEILIPVVLDYHWSHEARPDLWLDAIRYSQKAVIRVGNQTTEKPLGTAWGVN